MSFLHRVIPQKMFDSFVYESRLGLMAIRCVVSHLPGCYLLTMYAWSDLGDDKCFKCDMDDTMFMCADDDGIRNMLHNAMDYLAWMAHDKPLVYEPYVNCADDDWALIDCAIHASRAIYGFERIRL